MSDEIVRALSTLFPDGSIVELRAIADHSVHSGISMISGSWLKKLKALTASLM